MGNLFGNRRGRLAATAAVAAVTALGLAACGDAGGGAQSPAAGGEEVANADGAASGISVAFVPKIQGIPFFEAMNTGGAQAAEDHGFEWVYQGATTADASAQADVVRALIQQSVSALAVAPNDPDSMAPVLADANAAGIIPFTADTDAPNSERDFFVQQASDEGIGTALIDQLAESVGEEGDFAIVSCGRTAANLNAWIAVIEERVGAEYPNMNIVDTVYADEDQARAVTMAKDLMNAHPDLKGLIGPCTTAAPGIAQAVDEAGKTGEVQTVGVGTPQAMLPYLESGAAFSSVLWNVENHGYLTGWAGYMAASGEAFPEDGQPFTVGPIEGVTWDPETSVLLLGDPLILTADNAGEYDY